MNDDLERELDVHGLRAGLLRFTRAAWERLPRQVRPRVLDIGCGWGAVTTELARLSGGEVVGIDVDDAALGELRSSIESDGLGGQVTAIHGSLLDAELPGQSFALLWEEGVLHLLDAARSLPECHRLLEPGGFLVACEAVEWFESVRDLFHQAGFELVERLLWPRRNWWTEYYEPLEQRIRRVRDRYGGSRDLGTLSRYEAEIATVKRDPELFDCGHFLLRKTGGG